MSAVSLLYCFYCQGWLTFESQRHNRNHLFNVIKMLLASFHPVLVAFGGFFSKELNLWSAPSSPQHASLAEAVRPEAPAIRVVAVRSVELTRQLPPTASLPHFTQGSSLNPASCRNKTNWWMMSAVQQHRICS